MPILQFGAYMPDRPDIVNTALEAKNVVPLNGSYTELLGLADYSSSALTGRCRGAYSAQDKDANTYNFAADASAIYSLSSASWSDVSISAGYSTQAADMWEFTQYGENVYATNFNELIQTITLGGANFSDLSSDAPRCRHLAMVRDFLVAGNTNDTSDGKVPNRLWWSAIGDPTNWPTPGTNDAVAVQSDYQDLGGNGGWIRRVIGGSYGTIFRERSIWRMTYVGAPTVFRFDEVERNRGTEMPNSVIAYGGWAFYIGRDGFYLFDGSQSHAIGQDKVDRTFYADMDLSYRDRVWAALDPVKQVVMWIYPGQGSSDGRPNKAFLYNWSTKQWARAEFNADVIFWALAEGYTLEQLDQFSSTIDALSPSLDSRVWTGQGLLFSAFTHDNRLANFTGTALDAVLETSELQLFPGRRAFVSSVRPLINGSGTISVQVGARETQTDSVSYTGSTTPNVAGECPVRSNGYYHRFKATISGGFEHAMGIEVTQAVKVGNR